MAGRRATGSRAATPAVAALVRAGVWHRVHRYAAGADAFGAEAAREVERLTGVAPERVVKTLVLTTDRPPAGHRDAHALAVVPVTATLDLKAAAAALGCATAAMAPVDSAQRLTGYVTGGISPLGTRRPLATVVDTATQTEETVFCSAGRRGWELEVRPA